MTALRRRMLEDMQVRHLSAGTQQVYLQHIARFARWCFRHELLLSRPYLLLTKALRQDFHNRRSRQRQNSL